MKSIIKRNGVRAVAYFCSTLIFATTLFLQSKAETSPAKSYNSYLSSFNDTVTKIKDDEIVAVNSKTTIKESEDITVQFIAENSGFYTLKTDYSVISDVSEIKISLKIDGAIPYEEMSDISLPVYYCDVNENKTDSTGNEIAADTAVKYGDYTYTLRNENNTDYLYTYIEKGNHILTVKSQSADVVINSLSFSYEPDILSYKDYVEKYKSAKLYSGFKITEGEDAVLKSSDDLIQLIDNSSANVSPNSPDHDVVNYIGGSNYDQPGDSIIWDIEVPEDGLYKIALNYRQNYTENSLFYRTLHIDGELPFKEAAQIRFPFALNWTFKTLSDENDEPYLFYLKKGKHTLELSVTLGDLSEVAAALEDTGKQLASVYRSIIMITGDTPDANRDYNLFDRIEGLFDKLNSYIETLKGINTKLSAIYGSSSVSSVSTVNGMINVLELMLDNKYTAHRYISRYYDNYASLSSMSMELKSMPLDIDRIYFGNDFKNTKAGLWNRTVFSVKRFFKSFASDYNTDSSKEDSKITLWVNWGRDQAKTLKYLIQSDFTVKTGVDVDIKITNATLTHAALSGVGPDCQLHLSRSEPVNLAMRNAVCDLTEFDDYEEVAERFMPTASDPYKFGNGIYALPDTQTFYMMFVRDDIFSELGLSVPKTWDEFTEISVLLLRQNMQAGLPYTQIATMTEVNLGVGSLSIFPTMLLQNGGELYNNDRSKTLLLSDISLSVFTKWTDFYTKYGFSKTYDFFNRFRLGLMPMAIQSYTLYANLTAAAPEIEGLWHMYEVPGTTGTDGKINNCVSGGGSGAVILSASKHKKEAWEFLKWWTDADIQYRYGSEVEKILGPSARNATATVEALKKYDWTLNNLDHLLSQWSKVKEIPEVPGGYYVSRAVDQAFWNVTNASENPKDMLLKWTDVAQTEIDRKRQQYNIQ